MKLPKITRADEVTKEYTDYMLNRIWAMRNRRPLEMDKVSADDMSSYFYRVFGREAKNHAIRLLIESGDIMVVKEFVNSRTKPTTFYKLTTPDERLKYVNS